MLKPTRKQIKRALFKPVETESIVFPVPISDNKIITINNLPVKLKKKDAKKISRVIMALSIVENNV